MRLFYFITEFTEIELGLLKDQSTADVATSEVYKHNKSTSERNISCRCKENVFPHLISFYLEIPWKKTPVNSIKSTFIFSKWRIKQKIIYARKTTSSCAMTDTGTRNKHIHMSTLHIFKNKFYMYFNSMILQVFPN